MFLFRFGGFGYILGGVYGGWIWDRVYLEMETA